MKTEAEIKSEIRYWEGFLAGLRAAKVKGQAEMAKVKAEANIESLVWLLAESPEEKA